MAESTISIHEPVPSASVQVSNGDPNTAGSNQHDQFAKTKSLQVLESHAVEEHLLRELWFAKIIVKYPCVLCWSVLFVLMALGGIISAVHTFGMNMFGTDRAWQDLTDSYVEQRNAYNLAVEYEAEDDEDSERRRLSGEVTQNYESNSMMFYFTHKNYDDDMDSSSNYWILDKENIELMIEYENKIMLDEEWKHQFCYVGGDPMSTNYSCSASLDSIVRTIYELGNYSTMSDDDIKEWVLDNLDDYYYFMNPDVDKYEQVYRIRSFFTSGTPVSSSWTVVNGTSVRESTYSDSEMEDLFMDWVTPFWEKLTVDEKAGLTDGDLNIIFFEEGNFDDDLMAEFITMLICFAAAIVIVGFYMCFHLKSCCLGCGAIVQILLSFVLAFFCYRVIFQIDYLDLLSYMIIFVILGIGADDVFVFTDAWHQSIHFVDTSSVERRDDVKCCQDKDEEGNIMKMSFTFRRAASAMLTTQTTTFFAFIATAISSLMCMKAFGLWAATVVASNYVLVITLYPAMLMIHERLIKKWEDRLMAYTCCLCCTLCEKKKSDEDPDIAPSPTLHRTLSLNDGVGDAEEYRATEKFFGRTWSGWMNKAKIYNVIFFFVLTVVGVVLACHMTVQDGTEDWIKTSHWWNAFQTVPYDFGVTEDDGLVEAKITYGISGVDLSDVKTISPSEYVGDIVWDDDFEMYTTEQQEHLYTTCQQLKNSSFVYDSPDSEYVTCPIEEWEDYLISMNESFPYEAGSKAAFAEMWNDFLESWSTDYSLVEKVDGEYVIRYYAVYFQMSLSWYSSSATATQYRDDIDDFIYEMESDCPGTMCDAMGNACDRWSDLALADAIWISAKSGAGLAIPLAFVVLLISTRNWIVSIFAVLDIIGVILCEVATMYISGWQFGIIECISVIIVIGFSVDYVVHIANAYLESKGDTRFERMSFALLTMGVSVLAGAMTTALSSVMLMFLAFNFFYKMGVIILTVVIYALLWSLVFFTSIMMLVGPEGKQGDLNQYLVYLRNQHYQLCQKESEESDEPAVGGIDSDKKEEGNGMELTTIR